MNKISWAHKALLCLLMIGASSVSLQARSAVLLVAAGACFREAAIPAAKAFQLHKDIEISREIPSAGLVKNFPALERKRARKVVHASLAVLAGTVLLIAGR